MINYTGSSMFPTLKTGDILRVVPYKERAVRIGDVVLFHSPYGRIPIVHRIVSFDKRGIRTKGDNKIAIDNCFLKPHEITGRVVWTQRGKRRITIFGGFYGRVYALSLDTVKRVDLVLSTILRPFYRWFIRKGVLRHLFSPWIRIRVLCFKHQEGMEMQLHFGRRVIGKRISGQTQWHIQRPFKLFIDESTLP
jgi:signal peptidase I